MNLRYNHILLILISFIFIGCKSTQNKSKTSFKSEVFACYYHDKFNGRKTASGAKFSNHKLTAAHKTLAFGTKLRVTNVANNKSVDVIVNDRGPFSKGLELDLSKKAFMKITDDKKHGRLKVIIEKLN